MNHVTSIGLDVHARSVTAVALDSITGEVRSQKFGYSPAEIAGWILQLDSPKAVYESGVTGFHLVRELREMGVDCIVGAVSKMHKPASDRRKKNDRNDAEFLARQLMAHNIVEVFVPDVETEGARNLSRALEDVRDDLTRAKHRLTHLLIRWGYVWNEFNEDGKRRGSWTHAHWEWIRGIELPDAAARESLDYYISEVRHIESQKKAIEKRVAQCASRPRLREQPRVGDLVLLARLSPAHHFRPASLTASRLRRPHATSTRLPARLTAAFAPLHTLRAGNSATHSFEYAWYPRDVSQSMWRPSR